MIEANVILKTQKGSICEGVKIEERRPSNNNVTQSVLQNSSR